MTILVTGYKKRKNNELTQKEAMQILQDIKDGKRNDIPRIVVEGKKIKKSELTKFIDSQSDGVLKDTNFKYIPDAFQTEIYLKNKLKEKRTKKSVGGTMSKGLLTDDRFSYNEGEEVNITAQKRYDSYIAQDVKYLKELGDEYYNSGSSGMFKRLKQSMGDFGKGERLMNDLKQVRREMDDDSSDSELLNMINTALKDNDLEYTVSDSFIQKEKKNLGGEINYPQGSSLLADDMEIMEEDSHIMPDGTEMAGPTHEETMIPDEEMEDNYVDFIVAQTLSEEEQQFLNEQLEGNDELSIIFDKVVETASEFSGDGPVNGPGTEVSDDIPARLSDGEFVFTAKAAEEIGADNLKAMMDEAEITADKRQQVATGGLLDSGEEEVNANTQKQTVLLDRDFIPEDEELVGDEIKKRMMDPSTQSRYVRS